MKNTRKIVALLIALSMIALVFSSLSFAETNSEITVSKGVQNGNKVTFTIHVPARTYLIGDVNADGKVDSLDVSKLIEYNLRSIELSDVLGAVGDVDWNGEVALADITKVTKYQANAKTFPLLRDNGLTLTGSLASKAKIVSGDLPVKVSATEYKVEAEVTEGTGTLGLTIPRGTFATVPENITLENPGSHSAEVSSEADSFTISGTTGGGTTTGGTTTGGTTTGGTTTGGTTTGGTTTGGTTTGGTTTGGTTTGGTTTGGTTTGGSTTTTESPSTKTNNSNSTLPKTGASYTVLYIIAAVGVVGFIAYRKYKKN